MHSEEKILGRSSMAQSSGDLGFLSSLLRYALSSVAEGSGLGLKVYPISGIGLT